MRTTSRLRWLTPRPATWRSATCSRPGPTLCSSTSPTCRPGRRRRVGSVWVRSTAHYKASRARPRSTSASATPRSSTTGRRVTPFFPSSPPAAATRSRSRPRSRILTPRYLRSCRARRSFSACSISLTRPWRRRKWLPNERGGPLGGWCRISDPGNDGMAPLCEEPNRSQTASRLAPDPPRKHAKTL